MKIIIGMATMKGREENVKKAVESLLANSIVPNDIIVYNNAVQPDLTDNGKFFGLSVIDEPCYYFSCDDDLIYPPDYIRKTIEHIEVQRCIVSYHGRKLVPERVGKSYYKGHRAYACLHTYPETVEIDVCGTGVTAFSTEYFHPFNLHLATDQKMSDLVFSLEATKQGKKIMHIGHKAGWIQQQPIPIERTIYGTEHKNETRQIELACEIYNKKYND